MTILQLFSIPRDHSDSPNTFLMRYSTSAIFSCSLFILFSLTSLKPVFAQEERISIEDYLNSKNINAPTYSDIKNGSSLLSHPDDQYWSNQILPQTFDDRRTEVAVAPNGNVYVAGYFTHYGSNQMRGLAKWDGTSWTEVGGGIDGYVHDIEFASNGNVYIGGGFSVNSNPSIRDFAIWDGNSWSNMGYNLDLSVWAIAVDVNFDVYLGLQDHDQGNNSNGNLVVCGLFDEIGGQSFNSLALWDGATWQHIGGDVIEGSVYDFAFDNQDDLVVSGILQSVNGNSSSNVWKWDGSAWSPMGFFSLGSSNLEIAPNGDAYISRSDRVDWVLIKRQRV